MYNHKYRCVKLDKIRHDLSTELHYHKAFEKLAVWNTIDPSTISNIIKWDYSFIIHETLKNIPKKLSWMEALKSPYFRMYMIFDSFQTKIFSMEDVETIAQLRPKLLPYLNYQSPLKSQRLKFLLDMGLNPKNGFLNFITRLNTNIDPCMNYLPTIGLYIPYMYQQKQSLSVKETNIFISLIVNYCKAAPNMVEKIIKFLVTNVFDPFDDSEHAHNRIFKSNTKVFKQLYSKIKPKTCFQRIINERNSIDTIFNVWDSQAERKLILYIMIHQEIIPGINLLPIELMRLIFGYMRNFNF